MKTRLSIACVVLFTVALTVRAVAELREWTSARGAKIQAEFVELKFNTVVLKNEDGKLVEIPIAQLSAADQVLTRQLAMPKRGALPGRTSQPSATPTNVLPHFIEGKWAGLHAVYEHPKLDVVIGTNGFPTIYLKDNGKRVGPPISCGWSMHYYTPDSGLPKYRTIEHFNEPPAPSLSPERIRYKAVCQDKVKVEAEFDFEDNTFDMTFEFREPSPMQYPGAFQIGVGFHPTHSFADGTPLEKIAKELVGYSLYFKEHNRQEIHYDYHPHLTLTNSIVMARIKGPWGPRVLKVEQPRQGALYLHNYTLTPLYRGYGIYKNLGSGSKTPPIRFTVE